MVDRAAPRRGPPRLFAPASQRRRTALGFGFFAVFVGGWWLVTATGLVPPLFLASPWATLQSGWELFAQMNFIADVGMTVWRVVGGFAIAALIAVPLGIAMGTSASIGAFFEPFISFARYLPASAFIPLLILWVGIGEAQKLTVIFLGCFFQLTLMICVIVAATRRDLMEAAYTLGASERGAVRRVVLPGAAPHIAEAVRQVLGLGWTYVIVAELIGASSGIGHMITDSQALLATDHIIAGIVVIGLIGLASDLSFRKLNQRLFRWSVI